MPRLATLKAAKSLSDVAILLSFKPKSVSYILYKQPAAEKYQTFQIPKRNGGQRTINAPGDALKLLQRNLANLLQDCVDEIGVAQRRIDRTSHGFTRRRSIITNATQHRHRRWVFNLDLENFFPSINFGRVRGFLLKNRDFQLHPEVATVIAQIACHEDSLPQGSPCSPIVANLVAHLLDMRLVRLAAEAGCTYSRYADDLTFSTNKKELPAEIALPSGLNDAGSHLWVPGEPLRGVIERSGFRVNAQKTHVMYRSSRQEVTGLVVNEKISVRWEYRRNVRAMVDKLVTTGAFDIWGAVQREGQPVLDKRPGTIDELQGMLGFIDSVTVGSRRDASAISPNEMSSKEKVHRRFLFYTLFFAAKSPVIICEGETDNVYLTHAIRSLAAEFPDLAEVMPDNKINLGVRLYKYPHSGTARLVGLKAGGSSVLASFIGTYNKHLSGFAGGMTHPVIVLFDNDDGGKKIWSTIKDVTKRSPAGDEPFVHVIKNMFAVPTPGKPSKIEDFFQSATKATKIGGKSFNDSNEFDKERYYGKNVFAHQVVRPNAETIDFSRFRPLLSNLALAIKAHKAAVSQPLGDG